MAIKDDTDVEGWSTAWGSTVDRGICERDAVVVTRLRAAGAVIIGKTNLPELALWPWTASEAWGVTRNPWDDQRTPGGSSGGSAAAVCTGMAALALGSDGGGSVRYPAGLTGLAGMKPQRDRVPLGSEHVSGWHGLLVLGPLTRSVRDAALFFDVVSGDIDATTFRDAVSGGSRRVRVAVSVNPPPGTGVSLSSGGYGAVDTASAILAGLGHDVDFDVDIDYGLTCLWNSTVRLLKSAQEDVAAMPARRGHESRTRGIARLGSLVPPRSLRTALRRQQPITDSINAVFDRADVVLTPLSPSPAPLVDDCPSTGALRSLAKANTSAWLRPLEPDRPAGHRRPDRNRRGRASRGGSAGRAGR